MAHSEQAPDLRVAILGYGLAGSVFHAPLVATTPGMRVAAVVTGDPARQARARADYPTAAILARADEVWDAAGQYDLAVVAAPNRAHVPLALAALDAGIPVVVDKPFAPSVAEAEALVARAGERGVPLTVFQNRRWDTDFLTVRALLDAGILGPITRFESRFERYRLVPKAEAWRERGAPEEAGGLLYDLGSHLIDQALVLFGRPSRVYAESDRRRAGAEVDDDTFVALEFPNGVRAHLWMSVVAPILGPRMRVLGLHGAYEKYGLDPQEPALAAGARPGDPGWGIEPPERRGHLVAEVGGVRVDGAADSVPGAYERFYALLRDALHGNGPLPVDPADALAALRVIEAAKASATEGRVVPMAW